MNPAAQALQQPSVEIFHFIQTMHSDGNYCTLIFSDTLYHGHESGPSRNIHKTIVNVLWYQMLHNVDYMVLMAKYAKMFQRQLLSKFLFYCAIMA